MSFIQKIKNYSFIILLLIFSNCDKDEIYPWSEDSLDNILMQNPGEMILVDFETDW